MDIQIMNKDRFLRLMNIDNRQIIFSNLKISIEKDKTLLYKLNIGNANEIDHYYTLNYLLNYNESIVLDQVMYKSLYLFIDYTVSSEREISNWKCKFNFKLNENFIASEDDPLIITNSFIFNIHHSDTRKITYILIKNAYLDKINVNLILC